MVRGIVAGFTAAGGAGKSTGMFQAVMGASVGRSLLPLFHPVKPLKVMLFLGEDPEQVTWRRFVAIKEWAKLNPAELSLLESNLAVYTQSAEPLLSTENGKLLPTGRYKWMKAEIEARMPDLVVLDPKSRWFSGDENSNDQATHFVTMLEALVRPHNASLLITHHVNKNKSDTNNVYNARGASALPDAMRLVFNMSRFEREKGHPNPLDTDNNYLSLGIAKSNYSPTTPRPVILRQLLTKGGVIEQYDGPLSKTREIVDAIAAELEIRGPINRSSITDPHGAPAKEFVDAVRAKVSCTVDDRDLALTWGIENGFFVECKDPSPGVGRKATKIGLPELVAPATVPDSLMTWLDEQPDSDLNQSPDEPKDEEFCDETEFSFV